MSRAQKLPIRVATVAELHLTRGGAAHARQWEAPRPLRTCVRSSNADARYVDTHKPKGGPLTPQPPGDSHRRRCRVNVVSAGLATAVASARVQRGSGATLAANAALRDTLYGSAPEQRQGQDTEAEAGRRKSALANRRMVGHEATAEIGFVFLIEWHHVP